MYQEAVQRITYAHPTRLGIIDDGLTFLQVAILIEVGMYHTGTCLYNRNTGIVTHKFYQFLTATGDAEIHISHSIQQFSRCLVGGRHQRYHISRQTISL